MSDTPRIYVACLAAYNAGKLHGAWIDANQSADEIRDEVNAMLKASPEPNAEEWAIHGHEGFCGLSVSEYEGFKEVAHMAEMIAEHGEAWAIYAGHVGDTSATSEQFEEAYAGEWKSEEDFAEELMRDLYEIPEYLAGYIDYEKFARDLFMGDYFSERGESGALYVFRSY